MIRLFVLLGMFMLFLIPVGAAADDDFFLSSGSVPRAGRQIADELDKQLLKRIEGSNGGRAQIMIVSTVPVFLGNLNETNPLARQMSEEIMRALISKGYRANEIRKGKDIVMTPDKGEMILTRELSQLLSKDVSSVAILAGTYTITPDNVRFNVRLLHTPGNEILAAGSATVKVTDEVTSMLGIKKSIRPPQPSVFTRLPD